METSTSKGLFGPNRIRPGYADTEWSVWVSGMDNVLDQPDRDTALAVAAEANATACDMYDGNPFTPVVHAVVLYYGHAWKRGDDTPAPTADGPRKCACGDTAGPFVPGHPVRCEDCAGGGQ